MDIYLPTADYRSAQADLWASGHLARLNHEVAPAPPETAPAAAEPVTPPAPPVSPPPAAVAGQGSSAETPPAAGPGAFPSQPAPATTAARPPAPAPPLTPAPAPSPVPGVGDAVDQWAKDKMVDAWAGSALKDVLGGVNQTLAAVPQEAQGWARGVLHLPGATLGPSTSGVAPVQPAGIPAPASTAGQVATVTGGAPGAPSGYEGDARQAAQRYGLNPDIFVRQLNQESGLQPFNPDGSVKVSPAGARGVAQFMPDTARGMGINPDDPAQSIDAAARLMAGHLQRYGGDYAKALAAYNAGPGAVDQYGGVPPFAETQRYVATILGGGATAAPAVPGAAAATQQAASAGQPVALNRTSQFQLGLSDADAYAACGPAAAIAFARAFGRNPTAQEAMQLAQQSGWTQGGGMNGVVNEKKMIDALGVPTKLETGQVNWQKVSSEVGAGNPVVVSTPGHYFTIDDVRPAQGGGDVLYHVGTSGTDLRQGSEWMSQGQIEHLEGQANGALFADHPQAQGPSFTENVSQAAGAAAKTVSDAVQVKANDLVSAVQTIGQTAGGALTDFARNGPIGAFTAGLRGVGQNVIAPGLEALAQPGGPLVGPRTAAAGALETAAGNVPSNVPVVGGALQRAAGFVGGPSVLDSLQTVQDLTNKYPSKVRGIPNYDAMTPEDQAAWNSAQLAVGGILGEPGAGGELAPTAANINLAKYPAEVQDVIQAAAPTIPESATRGVVPDAVVRDLAQLSGSSVPDIVANWKPGQAQNAETIYALRDSLANQGRQVLDAQQALRANPASADAQAQLIEALTQHRAIQEVVQGTTAEAGRALRQFIQPVQGNIAALQQLQTLAARTGQSVDSLARDLVDMDLNDPQQMAAVARVLNPPRLPPNEALPTGPMPGQYGMFGQELPLGGPRPAGTEPPLPAGRMPGQQGLEIGEQYQQDLLAPGAGPFETPNVPTPAQTPQQADYLRRALTYKALTEGTPLPDIPYQGPRPTSLIGAPIPRPSPPTGTMRLPGFPNPDTVTPRELFNAYHSGNVISGPATITHVALNSFVSPAWSLATRGAADLLGGATNLATGLPTGNMGRAVGRGSAVGSALSQFGENFLSGLRDFYANPQNIANRVDSPILAGLFRAQQATGAALHSAFQNAAQAATTGMELAANAGERAWAEGLRGQDLMNRIGELVDNPTPDMLARAQDVGTRAALRGSAGATQQVMQKIAEVPFIGNTLFPVVRIGAQSLAQGVEKSPLGLFGTAFDVARATRGVGPYAETFRPVGGAVTPLTDRLTNNLAGTALTAFMVQKALDGTVTGNGPSDPRARAMLQSQGWQPNSIYVPGRGYMDYHALGPLAVPLSVAGNVGDAILYSKPQPGETVPDQLKNATLDLGQRVAGYMADATGLRTLGDLYTVLHGGAGAGAAAAQFIGQTVGGFVPESAALRGGVSAFDPFQRRPEPGNLQQVVQQGLPGGTPLIGGRTDVPVRLDVLGRPEANPQAGLGTFLPRTGTGQPDPTLTLLASAGIDLAANAPKTLGYAGKQLQLTPDEQQARQQVFGQRLQQVMQGNVNSQRLQALAQAAQAGDTQAQTQLYRVLEPQVRAASQYADQRTIASIPSAERQARAAGAPRSTAGVVPYLATAGPSTARLVAQQSEQAAAAQHAALLQQLQQRPQPVGAPGQ